MTATTALARAYARGDRFKRIDWFSLGFECSDCVQSVQSLQVKRVYARGRGD